MKLAKTLALTPIVLLGACGGSSSGSSSPIQTPTPIENHAIQFDASDYEYVAFRDGDKAWQQAELGILSLKPTNDDNALDILVVCSLGKNQTPAYFTFRLNIHDGMSFPGTSCNFKENNTEQLDPIKVQSSTSDFLIFNALLAEENSTTYYVSQAQYGFEVHEEFQSTKLFAISKNGDNSAGYIYLDNEFSANPNETVLLDFEDTEYSSPFTFNEMDYDTDVYSDLDIYYHFLGNNNNRNLSVTFSDSYFSIPEAMRATGDFYEQIWSSKHYPLTVKRLTSQISSEAGIAIPTVPSVQIESVYSTENNQFSLPIIDIAAADLPVQLYQVGYIEADEENDKLSGIHYITVQNTRAEQDESSTKLIAPNYDDLPGFDVTELSGYEANSESIVPPGTLTPASIEVSGAVGTFSSSNYPNIGSTQITIEFQPIGFE